MCGIIGFFKKGEKSFRLTNKLIDVIKNGLEINRHRGQDGYGLIAVNKNNEIITKKSLDLEKFIKQLRELEGSKLNLLLIHHRKASIGNIILRLQHPVKYKNIFTIHNGTNHTLFNILKIENKKIESDTEGISYLIYKLTKKYNLYIKKGREKFLNELDKKLNTSTGVVFSVIKLNILRFLYFHKDKSRSLYIFEDKNNELFKNVEILASEPILEGFWRKINKSFELLIDIDNSIQKFVRYLRKNITSEKEKYTVKVCSLCKNLFCVKESEKSYKEYCKSCSDYTYYYRPYTYSYGKNEMISGTQTLYNRNNNSYITEDYELIDEEYDEILRNKELKEQAERIINALEHYDLAQLISPELITEIIDTLYDEYYKEYETEFRDLYNTPIRFKDFEEFKQYLKEKCAYDDNLINEFLQLMIIDTLIIISEYINIDITLDYLFEQINDNLKDIFGLVIPKNTLIYNFKMIIQQIIYNLSSYEISL